MAQVQKQAHNDVVVPASPQAVWEVISDVTRIGEWSHECRSARWLNGASRAEVGARFSGTNRTGPARWRRVCELITVDPPHQLVWRTVPTLLYPDSTRWQITLEPVESGTRITQSFQVLRAPWLLDRIYAALIPAHRDRDARLTEDLKRIGQAAQPR